MSQSFRHIKAKQKRSSLQGTEKFERQLSHGGWRDLQNEDQYYVHMFKQLRDIEGEEKVILIRRLYSELDKEQKIKYISKHSLLSIILEETLPFAPHSSVESIMKIFSEDMRVLCTDRHASRVLQSLLSLSFKRIQEMMENEDENTNEADSPSSHEEFDKMYKSFILNTSTFVYNNLLEFANASYSSHIVCLVLQICSGVQVPDSVTCSTRYMPSYNIGDKEKVTFPTPDALLKLFDKLALRLTQLPDITEVVSSHCGSVVLQTALHIVSTSENSKWCEILITHILQHGFKGLDSSPPDQRDGLHPLFENNAATRLLEVVLSAATAEQQKEIFEFFFQPQLTDLLKHKFGNFTVQRLMDSWKSEEYFSVLFNSISENLLEAAQAGNSGVVWAFVRACRIRGLQGKCIKQLRKLYGCSENKEAKQKLCLCILHFITLSDYETLKKCNELPPFSQHGSLVLQELLQFKNPKKIVDSLLSIPCDELMSVACNVAGSHIFDVFTKSLTVDSECKEGLIKKFEGNIVNLACDKHGSRTLEALWSVAGVNERANISMELSKEGSKLTDNQYARIIYYKFKINSFNNKKRDWNEHQSKSLAKREALTSLLEETGVIDEPSKKKKKKIKNK